MNILDKLSNIADKKLSRKEFLTVCLKTGIALSVSSYFFDNILNNNAYALIGYKAGLKEASFYEKISDNLVKCTLCPEYCFLKNGQRGFCRVREPLNGKLQTLVYGAICAQHIDPIEKKPLFHFIPGSKTYSIATAGCNSRCMFCQNWTISQRPPEETRNKKVLPQDLILETKKNGCSSISYTYSEPNIFFEYVIDSSKIAKNNGLKNISVTGAKINPEPLIEMSQYLDASNVDLKGFDPGYLKKVCRQDLANILENIIILKKNNVWVEITNLIVPTLNDDLSVINKMVKWIKKELGPEIPIHFSRFWPQYKLRHLYPTPVDTLKEARLIALNEGMYYVYVGNVPELSFQSTICPNCKKVVIDRRGYEIIDNFIVDSKCKFCGYTIAGIWS